jgi:pimeloyl-ACP methyl ester carboxylesterase
VGNLRGAIVSDRPDTKYAKTPDGVRIAYQVVGEGARDLIFFSPAYPLDAVWEYPSASRFLGRLASFSRLILFDPHGWGGSGVAHPTFETFIDDIAAVMDAVGSDSTNLVGYSWSGPVSALFAATYPERTSSLVLLSSFARWLRGPDYPFGMPQGAVDSFLENIEAHWGTGFDGGRFSARLSEDEAFRRWVARCERVAAPPDFAARELREWIGRDFRSILPVIRVPTLVLHRAGDPSIRVGHGRYLAEHISGAKYVELPGDHHSFCVGDQDSILDEIEEFITGAPPVREPDRALATILFTDFVGSTPKLADVGDKKWTAVLDQHDALVRRELDRHRGRKVNTTGDGVLATFDGPARAVRCAQAICEGVRALGIEVRSGLHTGEVETRGQDIGGIAVHIAARVMAQAGPGEVVVSSTVKDLVAGSGIVFADRGTHALKGVPDEWRLYAVES